MYSKRGDEGVTLLKGETVSKSDIRLDFYGLLREVKVLIEELMLNINPFKYYFINEDLTQIVKDLEDIIKDFTLESNENYFKLKQINELEKRIELLDSKIINTNKMLNKINNKVEYTLVMVMKLERWYYKLHKEYHFQVYLNRLVSYFESLEKYSRGMER